MIQTKKEQDFNFTEGPYEFVDVETSEKVKPSEIKDFSQQLKLKCGQYNIDFAEADIAEGFCKVNVVRLFGQKWKDEVKLIFISS